MRSAEGAACDHVHRSRPHEVLAIPVSYTAGPPVLVGGPHRPQVREPDRRIVPAHRDPAEHAAAMAVDAVPHQLAHESANLLEATRAIKLDHADRHFIAALFADE